MKKNNTKTQHNPEKLTTQGTQDEDKQNKNTTQPRETDKIGYTRRRQTKQNHNTVCVGHTTMRKQTQIT